MWFWVPETTLSLSYPKWAASNCKIVETNAIFPVISEILLVNMYFPPSPLINVVIDLVVTVKVTSNNIERGRGARNIFKFSICFQECIFRWKSIFWQSVWTILQLLVAFHVFLWQAQWTVYMKIANSSRGIFTNVYENIHRNALNSATIQCISQFLSQPQHKNVDTNVLTFRRHLKWLKV